MGFTEISSILLLLLLLSWGMSLRAENSRLQKENSRLMKKSGEYEEMKHDAKKILKETTEIKTIKSLREKYGLSLIDAKEIVDAVKEQ